MSCLGEAVSDWGTVVGESLAVEAKCRLSHADRPLFSHLRMETILFLWYACLVSARGVNVAFKTSLNRKEEQAAREASRQRNVSCRQVVDVAFPRAADTVVGT